MMLALCPDVTIFFTDNLVCCPNTAISLVVNVCFGHVFALVVTSLPHATNIWCYVGSVHTNMYLHSSAALLAEPRLHSPASSALFGVPCSHVHSYAALVGGPCSHAHSSAALL